ncbi:MAG: hypothetical protein ACI835_005124, partial [Planctomycetota bacterium]
GPAGPTGTAGSNGSDGADGSAGAQGPAGPTGTTGPEGTITVVSSVGTSANSSATTTDILLVDASATVSAGDHLAFFSGVFINEDVGTVSVIVSFYVNGVQISNTEREIFIRKDMTSTATTQAYLTGLSTSDIVEVFWRTTNGQLCTTGNRSLLVTKVN